MRWSDKYGPWAVVTGASDGIGKEMATELASRKLHLVLVARRADVLDGIAAELSARHGIHIRIVAADLGQGGAVEKVIAETQELDAGLLVAAAGFGTSGEFLRLDVNSELNMIDLNCRAVVALTHSFANRFAIRKRGGLILMSSLVAFQGVPRAATYAATKAFIQTFAEGLGPELAPFGVDVLASAPGPVGSGFGTRANMNMGLAAKPSTVARATIEALGHRRTVRPGLLSKMLEASLSLLPRRGRARIMGMVMSGMTKHQNVQAAEA